jgi:hypothetical protein
MKTEKSGFILEHAEKTLSATILDAEHLGQNSLYTAGVFLMSLSACGAILTSARTLSLSVAALASSAYLLLRAKKFVQVSLSAKNIKLPGNLSENLQKPPYDSMNLEDLMLLEAKGYDARIKENAERNRLTGIGLNTAIRDLLRFPVVFVIAWLCAKIILSLVGFPSS